MTEKQFTRAEINKIIHDASIQYYRIFTNDMSLSEKLFFKEIYENIASRVDYKLRQLENGDDAND